MTKHPRAVLLTALETGRFVAECDVFTAVFRPLSAFRLGGLETMADWVDKALDHRSFRRTWAAVGMQCVQGPGDVLYVPQRYEHGTLSLDETVTLAVQGRTRAGDEMLVLR